MGISIDLPKTRVTQKNLKQYLNCDDKTQKIIVQRKQRLHPNFLHKTQVNKQLANFILQKTESHWPAYLITKGEKNRVYQTLKFHNLFSLFTKIFYCKYIKNKYAHAILKLDINSTQIMVFEDDEKEITNALNSKIPTENIFNPSLNGVFI